ncbi:hypothetical protein [Caballeronia glathei]|uniref:Uncharacterized protein n=1 Tax=Caballeronia glathei TaxID=60547 RepID=A0A069PAZ4_9BURK|nr:hypothetical protein [Caballeronia glathei]KDR37823.1 hypothetical protein BG61_06925 [Caballeronia glathei]
MSEAEYAHLISKCREAKATGIGMLSTGEKLAAAIVLNKPDWIQNLNYTLAEAFDRVGPYWWPYLKRAQQELDGDEWDEPPLHNA